MGNLLGSPVTVKETEIGQTSNGEIIYGVSSMQGWRVHMEDAHIAEPKMYAQELIIPDKSTANNDSSATTTTTTTSNGTTNKDHDIIQKKYYKKIELNDHSIYGVFDGHGGTFAAEYSALNLCRVLSRQEKFVQYAKFHLSRETKEKQLTGTELTEYVRQGLELLEDAIRDAFIEVDCEILRCVQGLHVQDANVPYEPYPHDHVSTKNVEEGDSSTPPPTKDDEEKNDDNMNADDENDVNPAEDDNDNNSNNNNNNHSNHNKPHPVPNDDEDSGTTAVIVIVTPQWIVCANAGDSRAVFCKNSGKVIPLSYDHKPDDEEEERRIRSAGGYVAGGRVEGDLAVSRGLGDFRFKDLNIVLSNNGKNPIPITTTPEDDNNENETKLNDNDDDDNNGIVISSAGDDDYDETQDENMNNNNNNQNRISIPDDQKVSPIPDIIVQNRNPDIDEFIIVACDGIWDVQTNYECIKTISTIFEEGEDNMGLVCEEVLDLCLRMGSKDNMTSLILKFPAQSIGSGGGVQARRQIRDQINNNNNNSNNSDNNDDDQEGGGGSGVIVTEYNG